MSITLLCVEIVCVVVYCVQYGRDLNETSHVARDHKYHHSLLPFSHS